MLWQIILGVCTVAGGIAAILYLRERVKKKDRKLTWEEVAKGVRIVIKKIKEDDFRPDVIIGFGRGGTICAAMVSGNMGVIPLTAIDRQFSWSGRQRNSKIVDFGNLQLNNKAVLLVVSEPYTGETTLMGRKYILERGAKIVKIASLTKFNLCSVIPDYYAYEIDTLFKMPWRVLPEYIHDSKPPQEQ